MSRDSASSTDQFLNLISSPFNTALSQKAFFISFGYSFGAALLFALLFCLLRPHNAPVYAPRLKHADAKHRPPPVEKGVFSWVEPVVKTKEQVLAEKIGPDATLFLRFTTMSRNIMFILSIVGCGVYIPLNITQNKQNKEIDSQNIFAFLTPLNVWGKACWAHVVVSYTFDLTICFFLWRTYRAVLDLRRSYFQSSEYQESLHSRTLLVTDIPGPFRSDAGVSQLVDEIDSSRDHSGVIARNVRDIPKLIEKHDDAVKELESIIAKYYKNPNRVPAKRPECKTQKGDPSYPTITKVDAITYLTSRIQSLKNEIVEKRRAVDGRSVLPYGFASYASIEDAHEVAFSAKRKHPQGSSIMLAPKPSDLLWENLPLDQHRRRWGAVVNNFGFVVLTLIWTVPNALIAVFLANLSNLGSVWPAFQTELERDPKTWAAVQGILAPSVTMIFNLVLPIIFRRLSVYAGDYSRTARERHVAHKLYAFSVFNNLIVFSLFSAAWKYSATVIKAEANTDVWSAIMSANLLTNLLSSFCDVSPFWLNYLLQRNFSAALDLSQAIKLVTGFIQRKLLSPTPRELIELTAPIAFDYANYYNTFLFYTTVALIFAPFQPLVLLVTAFYFALDGYLKKYLLLYVFITKHESGGAFWRMLFNRMLCAALLGNIATTIFIVGRRSSIIQVILMAPLLLILGGFKWYCSRTFDDDLHFYSRRSQSEEAGMVTTKPKNDKVGVRFGNPALYKPLIVPMVPESARTLLSELSSDPLGKESWEAGGYGDTYRLQQLSTRNNGQRGPGNAPTTFEVVNESQMDFQHFRDREEFREQFGGDGELYGHPSDLSRSSSPSSWHRSRSNSAATSLQNTDMVKDTEYHGATYPAGYHTPTAFRPSPLARMGSDTSTRNHRPGYDRSLSEVNLLDESAPNREPAEKSYFYRSK
ncbi:hypothetical protein F5Y16DRAFT_411625 [Xylariaceae sp. FL0255]|nr:hypothetical protein F5Y16DRAFT_411625 [Xylariaceae sp. FL0255]